MILGAWTGRRLIERMSEPVPLHVVEGLLVVFDSEFLLWPAG